MLLSKEDSGCLITAHTAFIEQEDYSIPNFVGVIELHTTLGSEEHAKRQTPTTPPPGVMTEPKTRFRVLDASKKAKKAADLNGTLNSCKLLLKHLAIQAQRILHIEGATKEVTTAITWFSPHGVPSDVLLRVPSRYPAGGEPRDGGGN
ncbi:unnamed protein product [Mycena citricolor]|uniref:Uncharacterized protein n=1 Tax=Mycena citricolor TaxID=2018698 RepID=A0AAD2K8N6_9AGAR|nr:unnamed protein product [Mycena citricolor]